MAQEYTITRVSEDEPRQYDGQYGTVYYYKVMLSGHEKPVEVGKKSTAKPAVGDTVYGTIRETEYKTDSFKGEKKPFGGGTGYQPRQPRDDSAIQAQWAIGQAVQLAIFNIGKTADATLQMQYIEVKAHQLFEMIDRVKTGPAPTQAAIEPLTSKDLLDISF